MDGRHLRHVGNALQEPQNESEAEASMDFRADPGREARGMNRRVNLEADLHEWGIHGKRKDIC